MTTHDLQKWIIIALIWIATMALMTCFFATAKDIPPAINTIVSVIVGGFVSVLTGKSTQVPPGSEIKTDQTTTVTIPSSEESP